MKQIMEYILIIANLRKISFLWGMISFLIGSSILDGQIRFNEVVSSNGNTIQDEDGDFEDWIELVNVSSESVELSEWGLSDNQGSPFKWVFPDGVTIGPGEYFLLWASGKNRRDAGSELHTNFSLSASGESLFLTRPDSIEVDRLDIPPLPRNLSFGRDESDSENWLYFEIPTPMGPNNTQGYPELAPEPIFSHKGGFYKDAFNLELETEEGWEIIYTLDGSDPSPERIWPNHHSYRRTNSYQGIIPVAERSGQPNVFSEIPTTRFVRDWMPAWRPPRGEVFKATVIRASAFHPTTGRIGRTVTQTYFVSPDIEQRYSGLPVISLVSDYVNLFDDKTGIYVPGSSAKTMAEQNFMLGWERSANIEFYENDRQLAFADVFDIRIQGATSPTGMQKAIRVSIGDESRERMIDYPIFNERGASARETKQFRRFLIRAWGSSRKWPVLYSDAHNQTLVAHSGIEIQDYRPGVLFINGEYWGLHDIRELNKNSWYYQYRTGISRDDPGYDILDNGGRIVNEGDRNHWVNLMQYARSAKLSSNTAFRYIEERVDIENLARYMTHCILSGKRDWPVQNETFWRMRTPEGRWRWTQYDMDHGFIAWSAPKHNMFRQVLVGDSSGYGPHELFTLMLKNSRFRRIFVNTCLDWLNSYYLTNVEISHFNRLRRELDPHIEEFNARWPISRDPNYYLGWEEGASFGRKIIRERRTIRRNQLIEAFGLGSHRRVVLNTDPEMGVIRCNSIIIDETLPGVNLSSPYPWDRAYYANYPIELTALPKNGYRFIGWHVMRDGRKLASTHDGDGSYYSKNSRVNLSLARSGKYDIKAIFEELPEPLIIHEWTFENGSELLEPTLSLLAGASLVVEPGATTSVLIDNGGNFATSHLRINNPLESYLVFATPTVGVGGVKMDYLTRRSGQGAGIQILEYTLDGSNWIEYDRYPVLNDDPQHRHVDFSGISGSEDNPNFAVRFKYEVGDGGLSGNNRFDDVRISGYLLPGAIVAPYVAANAYSLVQNIGLIAGMDKFIDLEDLFDNPSGANLAYEAYSSRSNIVNVNIDDGLLAMHAMSPGESEIMVVTRNTMNQQALIRWTVLVQPRAHALANDNYRFDSWSSSSPAMTFPPHMIFLQSEIDDPGLNSDLPRAYQIPASDAANTNDVAFPYAATSRSRINGLGADGIGWINTGRGRDLGAAVLALDTRGVDMAEVSFTAATLSSNSRTYAIRLLYRSSDEGEFKDLRDSSGEIVEYVTATNGHQTRFEGIPLPEDALGQPYIQLKWRYYHVSGTSGPRAYLRLDDIELESVLTTYSQWQARWFSNDELNDSEISEPEADPNISGISNLLRYALDLSPNEPVLSALPVYNSDRIFKFRMNSAKRDIRYRVLTSTDLVDWSEVVFDSSSDLDDRVVKGNMEVDVSEYNAANQFFKLEVTKTDD